MLRKAPPDESIHRLQVRVRRSTYNALQFEAEAELVSVAVIVRRALREHVERRIERAGGTA